MKMQKYHETELGKVPEKAKQMINWAELSRTLAGDRSAITKDRIPEKHKETIESLINSVGDWLLNLRP